MALKLILLSGNIVEDFDIKVYKDFNSKIKKKIIITFKRAK